MYAFHEESRTDGHYHSGIILKSFVMDIRILTAILSNYLRGK
jgi:hypothetical protein